MSQAQILALPLSRCGSLDELFLLQFLLLHLPNKHNPDVYFTGADKIAGEGMSAQRTAKAALRPVGTGWREA